MINLVLKKESLQPDLNKGLSVSKFGYAQIIFFVFLATLLYAKSPHYWLFRVVYSVFLYLSLWKLLAFYNDYPKFEIKIPRFYITYFVILFTFLIYNISVDFQNPAFNIQTQLNNPYGFLAALNIFAIGLGYTAKKLDDFFKLLLFVSIVFVFFCFVPDLPNFNGFHGYICAYSIIPFVILSMYYNKFKWYSFLLIVLAIMFSLKTDYRIIILRILMFFSLFVPLYVFRRQPFLKCIILIASGFATYEIIFNLPDILLFLGGVINIEGFGTDTRTFLYHELLGSFNLNELIAGRGFSGTYFSMFFLNTWNEFGVSFDRFTIEVGFLQLILKGGCIYYILFILPMITAAIGGIFSKRRDALSFALSIYIFSELLLMFFENIPNFGFNFFNLFFLSGYVYREISLKKLSTT